MMTKNEERNVLRQIEELIASTGKDSYIAWAFAGCADMARDNIENDFANSMLSLRAKAELDLEETRKHLDNANEEIRTLKTRLKERRPLAATLYRELWLMIEGQESAAKDKMNQLADVLSYANPNEHIECYLNELKQERIKRDNATRLLAELEKYEPKNV